MSRKSGWVYILSNPSQLFLKIGFTRKKDVQDRVDELDRHTALPHKIEAAYRFAEPHKAEQAIHDVLNEYRVNPRREYFKCNSKTAKDAIEKYIDDKEVEKLKYHRKSKSHRGGISKNCSSKKRSHRPTVQSSEVDSAADDFHLTSPTSGNQLAGFSYAELFHKEKPKYTASYSRAARNKLSSAEAWLTKSLIFGFAFVVSCLLFLGALKFKNYIYHNFEFVIDFEKSGKFWAAWSSVYITMALTVFFMWKFGKAFLLITTYRDESFKLMLRKTRERRNAFTVYPVAIFTSLILMGGGFLIKSIIHKSQAPAYAFGMITIFKWLMILFPVLVTIQLVIGFARLIMKR